MTGICRFCGQQKEDGVSFDKWVKPTFTDHDKLQPGDIVCRDCLFWFEEQSQELADKVGKDKPQRMRNYSHFILNNEWIPCSKGDKPRMVELLTGDIFPELAAIADSGQKHITFRARRNEVGSKKGWVQFEENTLWVDPAEVKSLLAVIEPALSVFSKAELQSGDYKPHRILNQYGLLEWQELEKIVKPLRGTLFFELVIFLAQRKDDADERDSSRFIGHNLAGSRERLQKPLSPNDLGAIREHSEEQCPHQQSRQIRQLTLFEDGS